MVPTETSVTRKGAWWARRFPGTAALDSPKPTDSDVGRRMEVSRCDMSHGRVTVWGSVEAWTPAQAGGTSLLRGHRAAGFGWHHEATDLLRRRMRGRTVERPGAHRRALNGAEAALDEGAHAGVAEPPVERE